MTTQLQPVPRGYKRVWLVVRPRRGADCRGTWHDNEEAACEYAWSDDVVVPLDVPASVFAVGKKGKRR